MVYSFCSKLNLLNRALICGWIIIKRTILMWRYIRCSWTRTPYIDFLRCLCVCWLTTVWFCHFLRLCLPNQPPCHSMLSSVSEVELYVFDGNCFDTARRLLWTAIPLLCLKKCLKHDITFISSKSKDNFEFKYSWWFSLEVYLFWCWQNEMICSEVNRT